MKTIINIIIFTPIWVWFILAYLIFVGSKSLRSRVVYLPKLALPPALFLCLKYKVFLSENVWFYLGFILIGSAIGLIMASNSDIKILKESKSVELPAEPSMLVILVSFFVVKYIFGYLESETPGVAAKYLFFDLGISGILSGYLLGRTYGYIGRYSLLRSV